MPVTLDMTKAQPISLDMSKAQPLGAPAPDPTTAGQPNSLAPALKPSMPSVQDIQQDTPNPLADLATGAMKGASGTAFNAQRGVAKALGSTDPLWNMTPEETGIAPNNAAESAGRMAERIGEYAIPSGAADRAVVGLGGKLLPRMLAGAAVNTGVGALHGETDPNVLGTNAALGAVGPAAEVGVNAIKPSVTNFFLRNLVKNTPQDAAAGLDVPAAVGGLVKTPMTKGGLVKKVGSAYNDANTTADSALSNYSGPNFDARPALQMIEDAKQAAAAQGHPQEYINAMDELSNAIKNRTSLGADSQIATSRTNPANLGMKKFQDTIARVKNAPGATAAPDVANDAVSKLNAPLNAQVPGYAAANTARKTFASAADQLAAPPPPAAAKTMLEKAMDYLPLVTGAGGAVLGHGNPLDAVGAAVAGAGLKGLAKGVPKVYNSTLANTAGLAGFNQLAPQAGRAAALGYTASNERDGNDNDMVRVKLPNGQTGRIQRWQVPNALHSGATLLQ